MGIEVFFNNPGFIQIGELIALYLDSPSLTRCRGISSAFKEFIDNYRVVLEKQLKQAFEQKSWLGEYEESSEFHTQDQDWENICEYISNHCHIGFLRELVEILRDSSQPFDNPSNDPFTFAVKTGKWKFVYELITKTPFNLIARVKLL